LDGNINREASAAFTAIFSDTNDTPVYEGMEQVGKGYYEDGTPAGIFYRGIGAEYASRRFGRGHSVFLVKVNMSTEPQKPNNPAIEMYLMVL
jgi:hypothetical protein